MPTESSASEPCFYDITYSSGSSVVVVSSVSVGGIPWGASGPISSGSPGSISVPRNCFRNNVWNLDGQLSTQTYPTRREKLGRKGPATSWYQQNLTDGGNWTVMELVVGVFSFLSWRVVDLTSSRCAAMAKPCRISHLPRGAVNTFDPICIL